jgi:hypothetical protein
MMVMSRVIRRILKPQFLVSYYPSIATLSLLTII